uniref:Uncharacterized protein n=6 Tax=Triticinae TaxID=1648030 RepID=A0A453BMJ6_AEGTS
RPVRQPSRLITVVTIPFLAWSVIFNLQIRVWPASRTRGGCDPMGAVVTAVIAIAAVVLGWITIEMACKPCLETGRRAMDRALDPNYDPDDSPAANSTAPPTSEPLLADLSASTAAPAKAI